MVITGACAKPKIAVKRRHRVKIVFMTKVFRGGEGNPNPIGLYTFRRQFAEREFSMDEWEGEWHADDADYADFRRSENFKISVDQPNQRHQRAIFVPRAISVPSYICAANEILHPECIYHGQPGLWLPGNSLPPQMG
jgi:hypothetical protein